MLFWKIFAVVDLLISVGFWRAVLLRKYRLEASDSVFVPVSVVGTLGAITYGFSLPLLPQLFWRFFLPIFIASVALEITVIANRPETDTGSYIGMAIVILLAGLTCVVLYRLAGSVWFGFMGA